MRIVTSLHCQSLSSKSELRMIEEAKTMQQLVLDLYKSLHAVKLCGEVIDYNNNLPLIQVFCFC